MKIHGFFGKAPLEAAYVVALFRSKPLAIERRMVFLIDTGALRTTISDRDAIRLGIDYSKLEKHPEGTLGIGGVVETYIAKDVELVFITQGGLEYVHDVEGIKLFRKRKQFVAGLCQNDGLVPRAGFEPATNGDVTRKTSSFFYFCDD